MKKIMTRLLSLVLLGTFIPSFVLADNWDLDKGSIPSVLRQRTRPFPRREAAQQ